MFCADVPALTAGKLTVVNRKTSQRIYELLRRRAVNEAKPFTGEVEMDESYFGPRRVRGKRGRGAGGKTLPPRLRRPMTGVLPLAPRPRLPRTRRGPK